LEVEMNSNTSSPRFGDDLDREVIPWRPEKDDRIVAHVTSIEWVDSRYGPEQYPLLELEEDGTGRLYVWHAAQAVAKSAIKRKNVRVGDRIAIKCLGDHPKGYRDFRIIVDHASATFDSRPDDELGEEPSEEQW
jgi:hypothetical protein